MKHGWIVAGAALMLGSTMVNAQLEKQGELLAQVSVRMNLTRSTCNLALTDRSGMPISAVLLQQIESGVFTAPVSRTEFALTPAPSSEIHCFNNVPDVHVTADFANSGEGNVNNRGSAGNAAVRLWGETAGGAVLFSSARPTLPMLLHDAGRLWFTAELNPINPSLPITAGNVESTVSFDVVYK